MTYRNRIIACTMFTLLSPKMFDIGIGSPALCSPAHVECPCFPWFACWSVSWLMGMVCIVAGKGGCDSHAEDRENQTWSFRSSLWVCNSRERAPSATQGCHPCPGEVYRGRCLWETNFRGNNFFIYNFCLCRRNPGQKWNSTCICTNHKNSKKNGIFLLTQVQLLAYLELVLLSKNRVFGCSISAFEIPFSYRLQLLQLTALINLLWFSWCARLLSCRQLGEDDLQRLILTVLMRS